MRLTRQAFRREIAPHRQTSIRLALHPVPFLGAGMHLFAWRAGERRRRLTRIDRRRGLRRRKRADCRRRRGLRSRLRTRSRGNGVLAGIDVLALCRTWLTSRRPNVLLGRWRSLLLLRRSGTRRRNRRRGLDLCESRACGDKRAGGDRRGARRSAQGRVARVDFQWFFLAHAQFPSILYSLKSIRLESG